MARIEWADLREFDVLLVTSLIWFLAQFVRYVFPPLFDTFRAVYGVSNTTLGLLFTSLMLAYAGMQFPSGAIADRVGTAHVIFVGALVAAGGALLAFGVRSFPALVAAAVLIGLGTGAHKTVAINLLSRIYPRRTGGTLGTMDAIGHLGGAAGPAGVVLVLSLGLGWGVVFLAVGIAGIAFAAAFRERLGRRTDVPDSAERPSSDDDDAPAGIADDVRAYLTPFVDPHLSAFVLVTVAYSVAWNGTTAFLPLYLETEAGLSTESAALVFGSLFLAALVQPVTGSLADRVGRYGVMVATLGLAGASLLALVVTPVPTVAVVAVPLIGLGGHGFRPVRDAYLVETIPHSAGGGTLGIVRTVMLGVGATAPAIVGYVSDSTGFAVAFGVLAGALVVGTGLIGALLIAERRG